MFLSEHSDVQQSTKHEKMPEDSVSWYAARATYLSCYTPILVSENALEKLSSKLQQGYSPNEIDKSGRSSLMYVAAGYQIYGMCINHPGRERAVELLLEYGADVTITDKNGKTVLQYFEEYVGLDHPATMLIQERLRRVEAIRANYYNEESWSNFFHYLPHKCLGLVEELAFKPPCFYPGSAST